MHAKILGPLSCYLCGRNIWFRVASSGKCSCSTKQSSNARAHHVGFKNWPAVCRVQRWSASEGMGRKMGHNSPSLITSSAEVAINHKDFTGIKWNAPLSSKRPFGRHSPSIFCLIRLWLCKKICSCKRSLLPINHGGSTNYEPELIHGLLSNTRPPHVLILYHIKVIFGAYNFSKLKSLKVENETFAQWTNKTQYCKVVPRRMQVTEVC